MLFPGRWPGLYYPRLSRVEGRNGSWSQCALIGTWSLPMNLCPNPHFCELCASLRQSVCGSWFQCVQIWRSGFSMNRKVGELSSARRAVTKRLAKSFGALRQRALPAALVHGSQCGSERTSNLPITLPVGAPACSRHRYVHAPNARPTLDVKAAHEPNTRRVLRI